MIRLLHHFHVWMAEHYWMTAEPELAPPRPTPAAAEVRPLSTPADPGHTGDGAGRDEGGGAPAALPLSPSAPSLWDGWPRSRQHLDHIDLHTDQGDSHVR